ncbi:MAG: LacI family DNA-binding transcriptional regulator, partial [Deinococcus sp.]
VPLYGAMMHGIEDVLGRHDMKALLASSLDDRATEARVAQALLKHAIDGGIVINSRIGAELPGQRRSPWVHITPEISGLEEHRVDLDNEEGGRLAAREFLNSGRRDFGYVGAPGLESTERERGYAQELALAGHSYLAVNGDYSEESGYAAGQVLLTGALGAVFVAGDLMAAGVLRALHQGGREVPGDVAVIGFDDALIASLLYPRLSTIHQPAYQMGAAAAQMTLDLIERLPVPPVTFKPHLVRRESTSAPDPDSS